MKKIKISTFIFLMALAVFALTACTNRGSSSAQQSTGSTQQSTAGAGGAQDSTQNGESGGADMTGGADSQPGTNGSAGNTGGAAQESGAAMEETTSGGVIDGLIDDVDQGVRDMTGDNTRAADETTR